MEEPKTVGEPKVRAAVLLTGSEVIYIDHGLNIEEPAFCVAQAGRKSGEIQIGFVPMMKYSEAAMCSQLNGNLILMTYDVESSIRSAYLEFVQQIRAGRSNIVIPQNGMSIIGKR